MHAKKKRFRTIRNVIAALIILAVVYFGMMPFLTGGEKMNAFCRTISPGMTWDEVHKLIDRDHYKVMEHQSGGTRTITIVDSTAMGRFICEVTFEQDNVVEARYIYND